MPDRTSFLTALFARFEECGVEFCISRNASETFANTGSDLDLVVRPVELRRAEAICREVGEEQGYRLALKTRFTNLCLLFWGAGGGFVRIDIEPGIRWRIFPVATAEDLLDGRLRQDSLPVPSLRGQALVLAAKAAWTGGLSERYRARLEALERESGGFPSARKNDDTALLVRLARENPAALRRWLIRRVLLRPDRWPGLAKAVLDDIVRIVRRVARPPGAFVRFHGMDELDWAVLSSHLQMGFPVQKALRVSDGGARKRVFASLFRGGLVLEQRLGQDLAAPRVDGRLGRLSCPANRIAIYRPGNGRIYLAHEASGLMAEDVDHPGAVESRVADFVGEAMARNHSPVVKGERGRFIVLVGLDGAGKTTFARNLCVRLATGMPGCRVRYHHWIPTLKRRSMPWPSFAETPRKQPASGTMAAALSIARLVKNLLQAWWVYLFGIRRWVKRGDCVIVDRFMFNYWLDPVSLRYSGPRGLLDLAARWIPQPDVVFSLEAGADTLLARKRELTREEIARQSQLLRELPVRRSRKIVLDATQSPEAVVEQALASLRCGAV